MSKPGAYGVWAAYTQSKLANVLFAFELRRRLAGTGIVAVALHPGDVRTNIGSSVLSGVKLRIRNFLFNIAGRIYLLVQIFAIQHFI